MIRFFLSFCILSALCGESTAAEPTYWADVRPILRKHCTVCHSERKLAEVELSAGLALDKPENIRKGSQNGKVPVLVPGKPDESLHRQTAHRKEQEARDAARRGPAAGGRHRDDSQVGRGRRAGGHEAG